MSLREIYECKDETIKEMYLQCIVQILKIGDSHDDYLEAKKIAREFIFNAPLNDKITLQNEINKLLNSNLETF